MTDESTKVRKTETLSKNRSQSRKVESSKNRISWIAHSRCFWELECNLKSERRWFGIAESGKIKRGCSRPLESCKHPSLCKFEQGFNSSCTLSSVILYIRSASIRSFCTFHQKLFPNTSTKFFFANKYRWLLNVHSKLEFWSEETPSSNNRSTVLIIQLIFQDNEMSPPPFVFAQFAGN